MNLKFIKKHKTLVFVSIVLLIILVLGFFAVKSMLLIGNETDKYGNRLDGIEEVLIKNDKIKTIEEEMKKIEGIKNFKFDIEGRLVYVIIEVSNETAVAVAKGYANKVLEYLEDEQKAYYDIQAMITSDSKESEVYPIIGAKHKTSTGFIW